MSCSFEEARRLAEELLDADRFTGPLPLAWVHEPAQRLRWEVFQGRLVDEALTRQERTFESWNVHQESAEGVSPLPLVAVLLDTEHHEIYVVRGVECHVWEGYDSGAGVYLSRERRKWVRELIATFDSKRMSRDGLCEELESALSRAFTGSRLPLTPVETPHPAFTLGQLWFQTASPSRQLEFTLRSLGPEACLQTPDLPRTLRQLFLDVSLSPYTDFVDRVVRFLALAEGNRVLTCDQILDYEAWLLVLVARHLTAYDLVTFHHRGANYPDALLLDTILADYCARLEREPQRFLGDEARARRRALRQGYLLRTQYEEHLVPDSPTSPGEHGRVYPDSLPRIPEDQILQPIHRTRRLFADDPMASRLGPATRAALDASIADLQHASEAEELGTAVFLDRPFGGGRGPVAADATQLLASRAYSRSIATRRLQKLGVESPAPELPGVPLEAIGGPVRAGTVSLTDAQRAAADFVFRQTMPSSIRGLLARFDFGPFGERFSGSLLLSRSPHGPGLILYDAGYHPRMEFEPVLDAGYTTRRGVEYPSAGLRITHLAGQRLTETIAVLPVAR